MGTGDPAHSVVAGVIVNLFKAGDTAARELQGITLVSICRCLHVAQAHGSQVHLHEAQAAFRSKRSCTDNLFVLTRILKRLARPTKLSMRSFWTCAKRMIRSLEDGLSAKLLEVWMESYGGSCET
jgi:hypothetical protein